MSHFEKDIPEDYWEPLWPGRPITETEDPLCRTGETYVNDKCQVFVYDYESPEGWPPIVNLSLKLNTREPWNDWRDFYRIKSELCGTSCWAIEVYPAQHALVDSANQYHMFVFPPGMEFPIQLAQAPITDYSDTWKTHMENAKKDLGEEQWSQMTRLSKQRDWHEHHKCDDLPLIGPVWKKRGYFVNDSGVIKLGEPPPEEPVVEAPHLMEVFRVVMDELATRTDSPNIHRKKEEVSPNDNGSNRKDAKRSRRKNKRPSRRSKRSRK